jgi:hypothetical protein
LFRLLFIKMVKIKIYIKIKSGCAFMKIIISIVILSIILSACNTPRSIEQSAGLNAQGPANVIGFNNKTYAYTGTIIKKHGELIGETIADIGAGYDVYEYVGVDPSKKIVVKIDGNYLEFDFAQNN